MNLCSSLRFGYHFSCKGWGALTLTNHSSIVTVTVIVANLLLQYYAAARSVVSDDDVSAINVGVRIDLSFP